VSEYKTYDIWCEGYAATGERSGATYFGAAKGHSFKEACDKFMAKDRESHYYDPAKLTYWACRLFDNETDARKAFG